MRKRSEVGHAEPSTEVKTTKKDGITFTECPDCGLKPSVKMAQATDPPSCPRCGVEIALSAEQLAAAAKDKPKIDKPAEAEPAPEVTTTPATPAAKAAAAQTSLIEQHARKPDPSDVGDKVSYTWGEEMYRFGDFNNCKVGSFYGETTIREGETRAHAMARLQRDIDGQAKIACESKLDDYLNTILGVKKRIERAGK
jgi:hypothetical protein